MRYYWPLVGCCIALGYSWSRATWKDDVGFTRLTQTFTSDVPTGLSPGVTQVEAGPPYMPDVAGPQFTGKSIVNMSGVAAASAHATMVGSFFYGTDDSLVPNTSEVDVYSAFDWLTRQPTESRRVQNHSWISNIGNADSVIFSTNISLDQAVVNSGFICIVGVDNGTTTSTVLPQLLSQSYNSISVGLTSGNHSAGFTVYDGPGRIKPELVAPDNYTSFATPKVSSAAGLLAAKLESAPYSLSGLDISLVAKALLLAGATKEEFPAWARTASRPLDLRFGAGELNVFLGYNILVSGRVASSSTQVRPSTSWARSSVRSNSTPSKCAYFFDIPPGSSNPRFSAALVWHRAVNGFQVPSLANLDLTLYAVPASSFTLVDSNIIDASRSAVDNIEHIYQPNLTPGRYALRVGTTSDSTDYALAWRTSPTVNINASIAEANEFNETPGQFTVSRIGPTTTPLYVPLAASGTALSRIHYVALPVGVLIPVGAASATIQLTPLADLIAQGDRTVTLTVCSDFSLSAGLANAATVVVKDKPYDAWRFAHFSSTQLASADISGGSADPDGDGLHNLLEYAFARDPLTPDSSAYPSSITLGGDGHLNYAYFRASGRLDLNYIPEWASDPSGTWQNSVAYLTEISRTPVDGGENVIMRAETPLSAAPSQFLRLRITRP